MLRTVNMLGVLGSVPSAAVNLGCCAPQVLGPLSAVIFTGGLLDQIPVAWQLPLLYGSLAVGLGGFALGWKRHRKVIPVLIFFPGAAALLYPFHESLDVSVLKLFVWLGFGLLLAAAVLDAWLSVRTRGCRPIRQPSGVNS